MRVKGLWKGTVELRGGKNVLTRSFHQAPLKVAKPFSGDRGELLLYLMDASPGLFNGDAQEIECTLEKGAHLYLTNQSSCKLHPSPCAVESRQIQKFHIKDRAVLEYFPEPLVPFQDAGHIGETIVHMESGGQAILGEIIAPGRAGCGEIFRYRKITSQFSVYWDGKWTVWDSLALEPDHWNSLKGIMEDYTHIGTLWVLSEKITKEHIKIIWGSLEPCNQGPVYAGTSLLSKNGLVIRMLGQSVWELQALMHNCWNLIRHELLGKPAFQIRK
ncbi:urease accessory protein UreD [Effusibacillus lacus]|uniref:Urease accessory protein UreD n=1 Tax=Effusibacillus lacus TaxID=1348429 RepID=A0A292YN96_9BACL|nr:urease accessory protein UreD [Effusibacillus lacus]TCS71238.1 urease accessory protein [Effusibacillus lacus]GAX89864.1 urease accessory protein UreD [Effusibacillus lacus]